jgi:PKD repeat protein
MFFIRRFFPLLALLALLSCKKDLPPEAKFEAKILDGGRVSFVNTTSGKVDAFDWDFGDTVKSKEVSPLHRYTKSGTYKVTLTATNIHGSATFSETVQIDIEVLAPMALHPDWADADGILTAYNDYGFVNNGGVIEDNIRGGARGAFYNAQKQAVRMQQVTLNGGELFPIKNNFYLDNFPDGAERPVFFGNVAWSVLGANGFPTLVELITKDFPSVSPIVSYDVLLKSDTAYSITTTNAILLADSIMYMVADQNNNPLYRKHVPGSQGNFTLDSAAIASLPIGNAKIVLSAFNVERKRSGGKVVYIINESRCFKDIKIE